MLQWLSFINWVGGDFNQATCTNGFYNCIKQNKIGYSLGNTEFLCITNTQVLFMMTTINFLSYNQNQMFGLNVYQQFS